jgi:hypothetical protein
MIKSRTHPPTKARWLPAESFTLQQQLPHLIVLAEDGGKAEFVTDLIRCLVELAILSRVFSRSCCHGQPSA